MAEIDVLVPCYNYAHYLSQCVRSVLSQADVSLRVIIIDDCSTDDTPQVAQALARQDPRITLRHHAVNQGHIATYNEGVAWARSPSFLLLSADDYLLPGALARAVALMRRDPQISLCYGRALELHPDGTTTPAATGMERSGNGASPVESGNQFLYRVVRSGSRNIVPTPTAVVRTELLHTTGGYRPELPHSGDFELWLRAAAHGSVGFVDADQAVYRCHANNMSRAYYGQNRLLDLQQREKAIHMFVDSCSSTLTTPQRWRRQLAAPLAREAAGCASSALNADQAEQAADLIALALRVSPRVRWSAPWFKLAAKRLVGRSLRRAGMPFVRLLRRVRS
jgi:glycosyltransferase involved in cell wall biosynthesis